MLKTFQWNVIIIIIIIVIIIIIIIIISIIIIDVIVVVDDDTYYWVYWSSDYPFQVYYKVRPLFYYKVAQVLIECKMQQVSQSATILLQSATEQGLQISSHDLGREGSRKARHAIKTVTASTGFFPDLFVHNYWRISHQTQSLHLSNTILKCL